MVVVRVVIDGFTYYYKIKLSNHRFIVLGSDFPFETLIELNRNFWIFSQEPIAIYRVF